MSLAAMNKNIPWAWSGPIPSNLVMTPNVGANMAFASPADSILYMRSTSSNPCGSVTRPFLATRRNAFPCAVEALYAAGFGNNLTAWISSSACHDVLQWFAS
eukprot:CAMPEP_0184524190 /NCGR_PEP_ID=MMETSP0198_2-20121128/9358_1 /TAXON_ID=1112570 /ORGANISM="Thraustochytrium sp., Strain LLF1b" /LENGTH=101 /DNA_ID=CAMNT_0026915417 /DNA_START=200 /DNA_END=505 /DNA_ORIENTATION=-